MSGRLESVPLALGQLLCQAGEETRHVYFPIDGLVSLLAVADGRKALEVGMVGRQGMVGVSLALGVRASPVRALVQSPGTAMRMTARAFSEELKRNRSLEREASRYANVLMATAMHIAACNNVHRMELRLARWLLMTGDFLASNTFSLTQEFLAQMLGVRRTGVSGAASELQRRRLIRYNRGTITILNRGRLRAASCGCYETIRDLAG